MGTDITTELTELREGTAILFGGNRLTHVSGSLAAAFQPGDRVIVVQSSGDLLHVPADQQAIVDGAVQQAREAFGRLGAVDNGSILSFYEEFATRLADDRSFEPIAAANDDDVRAARARGRSVTRLGLDATMRTGMIDGLRGWATIDSQRDALIDRREHEGWVLERRRAGLGVVGFVFEGRPNVFADAVGVVASGNTVVFRIGSDALGTARAIVAHALEPALAAAGLPAGTVKLIDAPSHAAGWALFDHPDLALAVARGSGPAVAQLGAVARQAGTPVSLHGTGGGWMFAGSSADAERLQSCVRWSLDRKVCNTLNVCCVVRERAAELVPRVLAGAEAAATARGSSARFHVARGSEAFVPAETFNRIVRVARADGVHDEPGASMLEVSALGQEWEWEENPELSIVVVDSLDDGVGLFNRLSPRLVATLIAEGTEEQERFWAGIDAPFVGDGMTRWVDGQYALGTPELGLSNWDDGRLFGRGGVLSGDGVFTVRYRARDCHAGLHR